MKYIQTLRVYIFLKEICKILQNVKKYNSVFFKNNFLFVTHIV